MAGSDVTWTQFVPRGYLEFLCEKDPSTRKKVTTLLMLCSVLLIVQFIAYIRDPKLLSEEIDYFNTCFQNVIITSLAFTLMNAIILYIFYQSGKVWFEMAREIKSQFIILIFPILVICQTIIVQYLFVVFDTGTGVKLILSTMQVFTVMKMESIIVHCL